MIDKAYKGLEPTELWKHFTMLNRIPRPSGQEIAVRAYVKKVADATGATWKADERGNTVVRVPAKGINVNSAPAVVIQSHLDMVCEKQPHVEHDFTKDPICPQREGDKIFASGTTFGADNGIGVAASLALLTQPGLRHGPLELLFTVEEETGLQGALALDPLLLRARLLINLDSENSDELIVGSAGAAWANIYFPLTIETTPDVWRGHEIAVSGLKGGHSGLQIQERLANAIKLLTGVLIRIRDAGVKFHLNSINGAGVLNAIPHTAAAQITVAPDMVTKLETVVEEEMSTLRAEWIGDEPALVLYLREILSPSRVMSDQCRDSLLGLLKDLAHGVLAMSECFPDKVETSSNLASIRTRDSDIKIVTSSRSFNDDKLRKVQSRIQVLGQAAGAKVELHQGFPGWEPNPHSQLLKLTEKIYRQIYGKPPEIQVLHGGLECGVIVSKIPGMEAISFGPLIKGAHTTEERVYASTVTTTWELLVALLESLCE